MKDQEDLVLLFTGSEIDNSVLKEILNDNEIPCLIKNDLNSARAAGFGVSSGNETHILVAEKDLEKAKVLLKEFQESFDKE
jgi:hypothetical protein